MDGRSIGVEILEGRRFDELPGFALVPRASGVDLAVISSRAPYRPPDAEQPALVTDVIDETGLVLAASTTGPFAGRAAVSVDELGDVDWIASPSTGGEALLGVWPGLAGRPRVAHTARDWLTKLQLVAAGCGVTTVPPSLAEAMPSGVQLMRVDGGSEERRRVLVARLPGRPSRAVVAVVDALRGGYPT